RAHLRLRAPRGPGAAPAGTAGGQRGHRRRPRRRHPALDRRLHRPVGPGREAARHPGPVPSVATPDRSPEGAGPMSLTDLTTAAPATAAGPKAHTVGLVDDVPLGEGRTFVVAGTQVAVF